MRVSTHVRYYANVKCNRVFGEIPPSLVYCINLYKQIMNSDGVGRGTEPDDNNTDDSAGVKEIRYV